MNHMFTPLTAQETYRGYLELDVLNLEEFALYHGEQRLKQLLWSINHHDAKRYADYHSGECNE